MLLVSAVNIDIRLSLHWLTLTTHSHFFQDGLTMTRYRTGQVHGSFENVSC